MTTEVAEGGPRKVHVTSVTVAFQQQDDGPELVERAWARLNEGHAAEAGRLGTLAMAAGSTDAEVMLRLGGLMMRLGRLPDSLACYDRALAIQPGHASSLHDRAVALMALGRSLEALPILDRLIAERPQFASAYYNRGVAFAALRRNAEAVGAYDRLLAIEPGHAMGWNNRGVALQAMNQVAPALESFNRAVQIDPRCTPALANQANLLRQLNRLDEALEACRRALEVDPNHVAATNERGVVLGKIGRHLEALADFDRVVEIDPNFVEAHENRFVVLTELGRTEEATPAIEEAMRLAPRRVRPYYNFTETRKIKTGDPRIPAMESLAADMESLALVEKTELCFSLGKSYADTGEVDRAFGWLSQGCALKRAQTDYNEAGTLEIFERAAKVFDKALFKQRAGGGDPSDLPVFILGMPRSGTTLVEQILASHPDAVALGEIEAFLGSMIEAAGIEKVEDTPEGFAAFDKAALTRLGKRYLDKITPLAPGARRTIDKSLQSFRFAGLIHMALPNARFIRMRRDPLDTGLSCFSKLFVHDLPYTYDLGELGRYYAGFDRLMDRWMAVLPKDSIIEVRYEDVVDDLEGQARRILAHCRLDWDPAVLGFYETRRTIRTASVNQVRQPLYATSVGRWKPYEKHLQPLKAALGLG